MARRKPALNDLDFIRWAHIRLDPQYRSTFDEYKTFFRNRLDASEDGFVIGLRQPASDPMTPEEWLRYDEFKEIFRARWDLVSPVDYRDPCPRERVRFFRRVPARRMFTGRLPHEEWLTVGVNLTYPVESILAEVEKIVRREIKQSIEPENYKENPYWKIQYLQRKDERKHRKVVEKSSRAYELREYSEPKLRFKEIADILQDEFYPPKDEKDALKVRKEKTITDEIAERWYREFKEEIRSGSYRRLK